MPTPSANEPLSVDPALVARFRRDLAAAAGRALRPAQPLALAVSGGPDSMAMLALAVAAFSGHVVVATFDHGFRVASAAEAQGVANACRALGVAHTVLSPPVANRVFRHAEARFERYGALQSWAVKTGADLLLTAHHADDQAETLLMRLNRGSGVAGLAGIRARRDVEVCFTVGEVPLAHDVYTLSIVRPLLGWRRAMLRAVAAASGLPFVDDPGNTDDRFERSRMRAFLAAQPVLDPVMLARSAASLGEAERDLKEIGDWLWNARRVTPVGVEDADYQTWLDVSDLPRELRRRLVRAGLQSVKLVNGIMPDLDMAANVEPLLDSLEAGRAATQAGVLVSPHGAVWRFAEAPPRRHG